MEGDCVERNCGLFVKTRGRTGRVDRLRTANGRLVVAGSAKLAISATKLTCLLVCVGGVESDVEWST